MATEQPCAGWVPNTALCPSWAEVPLARQTYALAFATYVIWALTGRRFGSCTTTVRPCQAQQSPLYLTYPASPFWALYGTAGGFVSALGPFAGCCGGNACACSPPEILLPGPVISITTVTINGVVLAPAAYRLDGDRLVRIDGGVWPATQDLSKAAGLTDTWSIVYERGQVVPTVLNDAAGIYACELAAGIAGGECRLPREVQSISRQGVDIQLVDMTSFLKDGLTGLVEVDQLLTLFNPNHLMQRPRVLSPDLPQFR